MLFLLCLFFVLSSSKSSSSSYSLDVREARDVVNGLVRRVNAYLAGKATQDDMRSLLNGVKVARREIGRVENDAATVLSNFRRYRRFNVSEVEDWQRYARRARADVTQLEKLLLRGGDEATLAAASALAFTSSSTAPPPRCPAFRATDAPAAADAAGRRRCAPSFINIGAAKAGSRTLRSFLSAHPLIEMAPKEVNYWQFSFIPLADYVARLPAVYDGDAVAGAQVLVGEKTPWLYMLGNAARIKAALPHAKLIMLVRDPIERAYSNFVEIWTEKDHAMDNRWHDFASFDEALRRSLWAMPRMRRCGISPYYAVKRDYPLEQIAACVAALSNASHGFVGDDEMRASSTLDSMDIFTAGFYAPFLRTFANFFPLHEQLLVLDTERMATEAGLLGVLEEVSRFLGIDTARVDFAWRDELRRQPLNSKQNTTTRIRQKYALAPMTDEHRLLLQLLYEPYTRDLERLLGRPMHGAWQRLCASRGKLDVAAFSNIMMERLYEDYCKEQ